jgi:hypothetical protein
MEVEYDSLCLRKALLNEFMVSLGVLATVCTLKVLSGWKRGCSASSVQSGLVVQDNEKAVQNISQRSHCKSHTCATAIAHACIGQSATLKC